jgi:hypothetical protein
MSLGALKCLVDAYEDEHEPAFDAAEHDVLRELMRANGLTQKELEQRVGIERCRRPWSNAGVAPDRASFRARKRPSRNRRKPGASATRLGPAAAFAALSGPDNGQLATDN